MSSLPFIGGPQSIHRQLEERISQFLGTEDTILYSSCFDANGGLFETLLDAEDAILSDELNHASIIDGGRPCKAQRFRYLNSGDRKSTRLNSSHGYISYAVFCLKKKKHKHV